MWDERTTVSPRLGDRLEHASAGTRDGPAGRARRPARRAAAAPAASRARASVRPARAARPRASAPSSSSGSPSSAIRARAASSSQRRVELAADAEHLGDREAAVERVLLGEEADARQRAPASRRADRDRGRGRSPRSAASARRRGGAASSCRRRSGRRAPSREPARDLERAVAQRPLRAVALAEPARLERSGHATRPRGA